MAGDADIVRDAARLHARDFYLSALLAQSAARDDLVALAAFHGEVVRIPLTVSEPMLGQVRLQWWRDVIEASPSASVTGNPIADALVGVIDRHGLATADILAPIDAGDQLLVQGAFVPESDLASFVDATWTTMFRLSARILKASASVDDDGAIAAAGDAYGRARLAIDLPLYLARGLCPVPLGAYGIADPRDASESDAMAAVSAATRRLVLDSEASRARAKRCCRRRRCQPVRRRDRWPSWSHICGLCNDQTAMCCGVRQISRRWCAWGGCGWQDGVTACSACREFHASAVGASMLKKVSMHPILRALLALAAATLASSSIRAGEIEDLLRRLPSSNPPANSQPSSPAVDAPQSGPALSSSPPQQALPGPAQSLASGELSPRDPAAALPPAPQIIWRVENPFRFFKDPKDTDVHRATFQALSDEEKAHPVLSAERALSKRHDDGWADTMYKKTCWNDADNRFECPNAASYINPQSHRVVVELAHAEPEVRCMWLTAPRRGSSPRGAAIEASCGDPVTFDVPYPGGMGITVEIAGRQIAAADIKVRDILIAGIGDSFGSGEGNPDVPVRFSRERAADYGKVEKYPDLGGYPARIGAWQKIGDKAFIEESARWLDVACHRSLYSHQIRAALQLAVEDPHRAVTLIDVACSGAEVTTGLFLTYKGNEWVPTPPDLSQISALAEAQCGAREAPMQDLPEAFHIGGAIPELKGGVVLRKCDRDVARRIDLLFVSIGGNDIGFARLLANAVLADKSLVRRLGGWFGQVHGDAESTALLDRLDERYKALNRAAHGILHIPWEESDRVVLTAYPPLAVLGDGNTVCPDGNAGMEVYGDFSLSEARARESSQLAERLHKVMANSAKTHGWSFADGHRKAFNGRGLCAGFTDNAFSIADDLRLPRKVDGAWQPYNPADFKAYDTRERWFRTPNDAFMTGNFHISGSLFLRALKLQSLSWFQILLASTYGGAFHPTAEGHAAIADAVVDRSRAVLAKYGQGERLAKQ